MDRLDERLAPASVASSQRRRNATLRLLAATRRAVLTGTGGLSFALMAVVAELAPGHSGHKPTRAATGAGGTQIRTASAVSAAGRRPAESAGAERSGSAAMPPLASPRALGLGRRADENDGSEEAEKNRPSSAEAHPAAATAAPAPAAAAPAPAVAAPAPVTSPPPAPAPGPAPAPVVVSGGS